MKKTPETMPEYTIIKSEKEPFTVKRQDLSGWFVAPVPGAKVEWSEYYMPEGQWYSTTEVTVENRARLHGLEGLEMMEHTIKEVFFHWEDRKTILQVTDTFQRPLAFRYEEAAYYPEDDYYRVRCGSFLDDGYCEFTKFWDLPYKAKMSRELIPAYAWLRDGNVITIRDEAVNGDVVGYYDVTFGEKIYHTLCYMYRETKTFVNGAVDYFYEEYIDSTGRIVLLRMFRNGGTDNPEEDIPEKECLWVNGRLFAHSTDAISEYVV